MPHTIHIMEPWAYSLRGHWFHFCADCARVVAPEGFTPVVYVPTLADLDALHGELPGVKIVEAFSFRNTEPYSRASAGRVTREDPLARRIIRNEIIPRLRHLPRALGIRERIRAENLAYRANGVLRGFAVLFGSSVAERETLAIAEREHREAFETATASGEGPHHLFLPGGELFQLQALARLIEAGACDAFASIHVRSWVLFSFECQGVDLRPIIRSVSRNAASRGVPLFWYCEVPWAQRHLQALLGRTVSYLDINSFRPQIAQKVPWPRKVSGRPILLFPGVVRRYPDKGLSFISELAELLAKDRGFIIQMQAIPEAAPELEYQRVFDLEHERMKITGVVDFLPDTLDGEHYWQTLADCFAVVIPYDRMTWLDSYRGSGVFLEALLCEKPIFVRRGLPLSGYEGLYDLAQFSTAAELVAIARQTLDGTRKFDLAGNRRRYLERLARNDMMDNLRARRRDDGAGRTVPEPALRKD